MPGFPGYHATTDGRLISERRGEPTFIAVTVQSKTPKVTIWSEDKGKMVTLSLGRLIASAFHGASPERVLYLDGDRLNCSPSNLRWKGDEVLPAPPEGAREVPGFPGYFVLSEGVIYSGRSVFQDGKYRRMAPTPDGQGYLRVTATNASGYQKSLKVHRAVALAFIGQPPTRRHEVRHLDGNLLHNWVDNLRWGLPVENAADRAAHGTQQRGSAAGLAKLAEVEVVSIRELFGTGNFSYTDLARQFGVSKPTIGAICRRETWQHV